MVSRCEHFPEPKTELIVRAKGDWVPLWSNETRLGSEAPTSFKFGTCLMSPDRLWSFLWGELLLLPAQMWRELNMNIWSRNLHTGVQAHATTHSCYLWCTQTAVSKGRGKGHPAVLSSPQPAPLGRGKMDPCNGLLFPSHRSHASCVPVEQNYKDWHGCGKS